MADDDKEYECPSCGGAFEGDHDCCPMCGQVLDWSEEPDYECPDCGADVKQNSKVCPECGVRFVSDDTYGEGASAEDEVESAINEVLNDALDGEKVGAGTSEGLEGSDEDTLELLDDEHSAVSEDEDGTDQDTGHFPVDAHAKARPTSTADGAGGDRSVPDSKGDGTLKGSTDITAPVVMIYPGGFTRRGVVFVTLAVLAIAMTLVMMRYDTLIQGAEVETLGRLQWAMVGSGIVAFVVCAGLSITDILRTARART